MLWNLVFCTEKNVEFTNILFTQVDCYAMEFGFFVQKKL